MGLGANSLRNEAQIRFAQKAQGARCPSRWRRLGCPIAPAGEHLVPKTRVLDALSNGQVSGAWGEFIAQRGANPFDTGTSMGRVAVHIDGGDLAVQLHLQGRSWCQKLEFWMLFLMGR